MIVEEMIELAIIRNGLSKLINLDTFHAYFRIHLIHYTS